MSLSSYNPHDRYRQRSVKRMTSVVGVLCLLSATLGLGFWLGGVGAQQSLYILEEEKRILSEEHRQMQSDLTELRAEAQTATVRLEQLRVTYEDLVDGGAMQDLVTLLRKQIEAGIDVKRLESIILSARPPQNCSEPVTKRFVVITSAYNGPSSSIITEDGMVSVSGIGAPARNDQDKKEEVWFDPGQSVTLEFKAKDGKAAVKSGILPFYHSVVVGDKEYRFTIAAGAKSFAKVSYDFCDYP